ncbi:hypothetical protein H8356DRAFT_1673871 [Neocallimastix lanati (nom. inval.)]|nr:hypothetical protein H8356DRAFT_1673871 [Neocallimastix sp. JGI-2020a]
MILKKIKRSLFLICLSLAYMKFVNASAAALQECTPDTNTPPNTPVLGYCLDGSIIKKVTTMGTAGSAAFGKGGLPSGNVFFNTNALISSGTANGFGYSCGASGCTPIIEESTYYNSQAKTLSCAYLKCDTSSSCTCAVGGPNQSYFDNFTKKVINCSSSKCTLSTVAGYYIDYGSENSNQYKNLITCSDNKCNSEPVNASETQFYLNAGLNKSSYPIIYFDTSNFLSAIASSDTSKVFVDTATKSGDNYKNIIVCSSTTKCSSVTYESGIFLNGDQEILGTSSQNKANLLIECSSTGCSVKKVEDETGDNSDNLYYVDGLSSKLIQCVVDSGSSSITCSIYTGTTAGKYYLDYASPSSSNKCSDANAPGVFGPTDGTNSAKGFCSLNIISCDKSQLCTSKIISTNSQYIDGDKDTNLLMCASFEDDFFCTSVQASSLTYYYINTGNTSKYPLLYCGVDASTTKCIGREASTNGYYLTDSTIPTEYGQNYVGYFISCSSTTKCDLSTDLANKGYYLNAAPNDNSMALIYYDSDDNLMREEPAEGDSYYLDASSLMTNEYANLIYCETSKKCESLDPNDGYYINAAGDDTDELYDRVIKCDKTGCDISDRVQSCVVETGDVVLKPGNYCFQKVIGDEQNDLNFVLSEFTITKDSIEPSNQNITYISSGANYHYVTVTSGNFPGVTGTLTTLFEVKSNSISRVVGNGLYIINPKNERVESVSGSIDISKSYAMYTCSSSSELCTKVSSCKSGTYSFDEINNKGYQCVGSEISPIDTAGYYLDSSYVVNRSLTPGVLKCEENGNCVRYTPKNTYFLNAGMDNTSKALIYCSSSSCKTQEASIGYYRAEFGQSGVIVCTSSTQCKISSLRYNYYLNNGEDKSSKPIIACKKNVNCSTVNGYVGYYLIQENGSLLINCKMASTCEVEEGSVGYYYNSANNYHSNEIETVIKCYTSSYTGNIVCTTEKKNEGYYLSGSGNNILVDCIGSKCKTIEVENGIFRSAASIKTSVKNVISHGRDMSEEMEVLQEEREDTTVVDHEGRYNDKKEMLNKESNVMLKLNEQRLIGRAQNSNEPASTLIICSGSVCNELTAEELTLIPICTYNNEMCYLDNSNNMNNSQNKIITSVSAGDFCTDMNRSTLYFATETIVEYNDVISGVLSTSKTVTKNCIKASAQYNNSYFTVGNTIYKVNDGLIMEIHEKGYYFINISKNILVYGTEIKDYNNSSVLLYKCDGVSCRIMDKPTSDTYYTDVTKRILKYSVEDGKYSFINKKENICTFADNTCTPKYDIEENDFCITAEGYIVVAGEKIKSRETGKCFMSSSISENVLAYSYNSVLYLLNSNAAKQVTTSGYYFAENNYYNSAEYKSFNTTTAGITLYGCNNDICQIYEPQPDVYYFDMITNYLIQKKGKVWVSPIKVGYINVSINPEEVYIYSYTMTDSKELLLTKTTEDGWYYTIDNKMYQCWSKIKTCKEIDDTAYVFTNSNEVYYCVVDSEGEPTECFKRTCNVGEIYYMKDNYYRCTAGSYLELVRSRHCDHDEVVVVNFPLIYSDSLPINIYNTISDIARNNHHVPTQKLSRSSLETIQGVFTNCTYNAYDEYATYDQVCIQNYVKLNKDNEPDICSVKLLGYTYCTVEDGDDPNKCNPSSAVSLKNLTQWSVIKMAIAVLAIILIAF